MNFNSKYKIKKLTGSDLDDMLALAKANKLYYSKMNEIPTKENLKFDLTNVPDGVNLSNKHFVGFYEKNKLIAMLDLITNYPNEKMAYIGWFILDINKQGKGIGFEIYKNLERYLQKQGFQKIELGFIKGNEQSEKFWLKCGFSYQNKEKNKEKYTIIKMQKKI